MQRWITGTALGLLLSVSGGYAATPGLSVAADVSKAMATYAKQAQVTDLGICTPEPVDGTHYVCGAVGKGDPFPVLCKVGATTFCFQPVAGIGADACGSMQPLFPVR